MEINWQESGWIIVAAIGVLGLIMGLAIGWLGRGGTDHKELSELRKSHNAYKDDVTLHFEQTGQLVHQLTEQYKSLYEHLAQGAVELAEGERPNFPLLENSAGFAQIEQSQEQTAEPVSASDAPADTAAAADENDALLAQAAFVPPDVPAPEEPIAVIEVPPVPKDVSSEAKVDDDLDAAINAAKLASEAHTNDKRLTDADLLASEDVEPDGADAKSDIGNTKT